MTKGCVAILMWNCIWIFQFTFPLYPDCIAACLCLCNICETTKEDLWMSCLVSFFLCMWCYQTPSDIFIGNKTLNITLFSNFEHWARFVFFTEINFTPKMKLARKQLPVIIFLNFRRELSPRVPINLILYTARRRHLTVL